MSRGALPSDDEEEDEETLQLKLQAIEAKLKLKALQKAKKANEMGELDGSGTSSRSDTTTAFRRIEIPRANADIQVPHSPVRNRREPEEQRSPARVLLGIDKGLTARDISLKRPGSSIKVVTSRTNLRGGAEPPKIKSFSERIAESRNKEKQREENEAKLEERRNRGFGLQHIEGLKPRPAISRSNSSQDTVMENSQDMPPPSVRGLNRVQSRSVNDLRNPPSSRPGSTLSARSDISQPSSSTLGTPSRFGATPTASRYAEISQRDNSSEAPSFESFSGLHLKSREMQHNVVARTLDGKTVLTIPQLLKTVKAPDYDPPDWENDYVVLGVICSKSNPLNSKNSTRDQTKSTEEKGTDQNGKFMVIRLTDLKWELDLFLFDTGFSHFWKLPLGTLVAVLNPDIMPPRNRDTGKFSLKLTSSDDTILELGTARDLDFCHAKRKDGKDCGQWIDGRKTEFCEFHIQLQVDKSRKGRMEINTMTGFGNGSRGGGKFGMFGSGRGGAPKGDELKREGKFHDRGIHETLYIAPQPGGTAKLIDRDQQGWERGASREERFRKQLAEKEKERDLAKRLGTMGDGTTGGDYMKLKGADTPNLPARGYSSLQGTSTLKPEQSMESDITGLLGRTAADVSLAPVKRKRIASGKSTISSEPVGWGFKYGRIPSPQKEPSSALRGSRETSPTKKRARLLLPEKGIRTPGRESLGGMDVGLIAAMDDEDDDLEVV